MMMSKEKMNLCTNDYLPVLSLPMILHNHRPREFPNRYDVRELTSGRLSRHNGGRNRRRWSGAGIRRSWGCRSIHPEDGGAITAEDARRTGALEADVDLIRIHDPRIALIECVGK